MLAKSPAALRADFQRFYHLDIDQIGHGIRPMRAADLAVWLPDNARIWSQFDPRAEWDAIHQLLANIADSLAFLAWAKTPEAARKGARFKGQLQRPGTKPEPIKDTARLDVDSMRAMLARPRS
ncbi:hypothetical protein JS528_09600 [Bifidobacterium sp. MA2]|uniref:Uncharacterized protein n=2 Tax=Bifidobacterium santillanense TaxID=2809028 RepID=A0ABS5URI2_9BIFI|nr:DUF5361 domain-containing protein [Bifidobacterium santillanense]MBT1173589.1 hypothetical protein [Bifidobacterium santillanense]